MKFTNSEYTITKEEELKLRKRVEALKGTLQKKQTVHLTMITTFGVSHGKHSGIAQKAVTIDDLFE